ncbi:hypothetical protein LQZ18_08285 [Lachnospiraceae bacterium ZAX-1]
MLLDETGAVNRLFDVGTYPTSVFLDKNGNIVKKIVGDANAETIAKVLKSEGSHE